MDNKLKKMVYAAVFASLTAAVAWFKIPLPFTPVPITLQTVFVLISGAALGSVYGALAMIVYLLLGIIGLPVFQGGTSGPAVILGPTGGYLMAFPVAAFIIGYLTHSSFIKRNVKKDYYRVLISMLVGTLIIYTMGSIQGMIVTGLSLIAIITGWILPFIIGDLIKLLLALWIYLQIQKNKLLK